jgi:hypothetical protein|nr:MAG TPA: hypothetical protein [Caudoviricetes sp.]
MGKLKETAQWENDIYQIEVTDPALGGESGPVNTAPRQLVNRTRHLKDRADRIDNELTQARGGKTSLAERINALEETTAQGDFSFAGTRGQTITNNLGHTNYVVNTSATSDTDGDMGDVYISRAANAFTVYNTGGYRGGGRYQIMN